MILARFKAKPSNFRIVVNEQGEFESTHPDWIVMILDDPFLDWSRCKACGVSLAPKDQVRVFGYQATLCLSCATTALRLDRLMEHIRLDVSLELVRNLRDGHVYESDNQPGPHHS